MLDGFDSFYIRIARKNRHAGSGSVYQMDEQGRAHVMLYSEFFVKLPGNFLCTNKMYQELKEEITASVEMLDTRKQVVMEVYEPRESDEYNREAAVVGFRRFLESALTVEKRRFRKRMAVFIIFMAIGLSLEFVLHGLNLALLPAWGDNCLDIMATVFVWQFVGYMAYEYQSNKSQLRRMRQMIGADFIFRKWE